MTFSLAFDATTVENGALKFVTGSGDAGVLHPHLPVAASGNRDEAHAVAVRVDEATAPIEVLCVKRGDVTIHDEWVVHGSGGNLSKGTRRTYVAAFRTADTVARERKAGFSHSHMDTVNWDNFDRSEREGGGARAPHRGWAHAQRGVAALMSITDKRSKSHLTSPLPSPRRAQSLLH